MIRRRGLVNFFGGAIRWSCASRISCHHRVRTPLATCRSRRVVIRPPGSPCTIASVFEPRRRRGAVRSCACRKWRGRANSLKAIFESNREKLAAARAEVREIRRTAKQSLALKQEVARPGQLLAEAGARKRSTVVSLRMENASLKTAMRVLKGRGGERQASFEQVVQAQKREEAAGVIEARPAARHSWPPPALEEVEGGWRWRRTPARAALPTVRTRIIEIKSGGLSAGAVTAPVHRWRLFPGTAFGCGRMCCTSACMRAASRGFRRERWPASQMLCPCSSRFGTRSSRTGVCAMPMHPGPEGGPEVAPGSRHRSAVTRFSPSRSAEVAAKLFADGPHVCDRCGACKKLARLWPFIILCCCRAHCRRDFPDCAGRSWRGGNGSIAEICRLNTARLPCFRRRSRPRRRRWRLRSLFAEAPRLPKAAPEGRPLRSTIACLSTMDNNFGERAVRGPGGSPASVPTAWTAVMYTARSRGAASTFCAGACAENGGPAICRPGCREPGEAAEIRSAAVRSRARLHGRAVLRRSRSGPHRPRLLPPPAPEANHTAAPKTLDEPRPLTRPRIHAPGGAADALPCGEPLLLDRRMDRALQHHARALRDPGPAPRRLPDPRRNNLRPPRPT